MYQYRTTISGFDREMLLIKPHSHILSPPPNKKVSSQEAIFYNVRGKGSNLESPHQCLNLEAPFALVSNLLQKRQKDAF